MVTIIYCDIEGCNEEVWVEGRQIDVCTGYLTSSESASAGYKKYKPFEKLRISKRDLCVKHLKMWSKATYEALYGKVGSKKE